MNSVIVKNQGRIKLLFFEGEYPEICPKCDSDFLTIDSNGFGCINCGERYNLICSDEELKGGKENGNN